MDERYSSMQQYECRTFEEWQRRFPNKHYITVIIDEVSDLFMQNRKQLENYIIRLCQLGRACGIHVILATQRPSSEVLSGLIRDNIPSRVAFAVSSGSSSRIILDQKGAETLRGQGDGLFKANGMDSLIRFQSAFMSTDDLIVTVKNYKNKQTFTKH